MERAHVCAHAATHIRASYVYENICFIIIITITIIIIILFSTIPVTFFLCLCRFLSAGNYRALKGGVRTACNPQLIVNDFINYNTIIIIIAILNADHDCR